MKLCISVGLLKVKVGLVFKEMKTLFELMFALPTCDRAGSPTGAELELVSGVRGGGGAAGVGVGAVDLQTDGCPLQMYPLCTLQLTHPGEVVLPVSHASVPTTSPSPQTAPQTP